MTSFTKHVLYVAEPGACIRQTHARLRVTKGETLLQEVRLKEIERVVLLSGTAGLTAPAAACLLENGIDTAFVGPRGTLRGYLTSVKSKGIHRRLAQYDAFHNPTRRLELAQRIVERKILNGEALLGRYERNHPEANLMSVRLRLKAAALAARQAPSIESLFGFEGDAAATYWRAYGSLVPEAFRFTVRSRRPPKDAANALLSYGYAILAADMEGAIQAVGLDAGLGMLHVPDSTRASLALDLMEEFRAAVVDRLVLALLNGRLLKPDDFIAEGEGIRLTPDARRTFLSAYEAKLEETTRTAPNGLRERLFRQAQRLAKALEEGKAYRGYALR